MSVDLYQPCPGGLDKKIKFCCKDLAHELDKIGKLVKADQDKAALEFVERMVKKHPDRQCLLAWLSRLKIALVTPEEARPAVEQFLAVAPDNPMAHCNLAVVEARTVDDDDDDDDHAGDDDPAAATGDDQQAPDDATLSEPCRRAIAALQKATETMTKVVPGHLPSVFVMVGRRLLIEGFPIAAREHLSFALMFQENAENPLGREELIESYHARSIPLLLKDSTVMPRCPGHVGWKGEYNKAVQDASRGRWRSALRQLEALDQRDTNHPTICLAIANLHLRLAQHDEAVKHLRTFAGLDGVSEQDAVYTEALAMSLDQPQEPDGIDVLRCVYDLSMDSSALIEQLLASKQAVRLTDDMSEYADDDEPPPLAGFTIVDRDMPEDGDSLEIGDVPRIVGEAFVFGKQTDREARLEFDVYRDWRYDGMREFLGSLNNAVGLDSEAEEVLDSVPVSYAAMTVGWRMPDNTEVDKREKLLAEKQRVMIHEQWPDLPQTYLDGKTPREAAQDPGYRRKVLALVLTIEAGYLRYLELADFDKLYTILELPIPQARSIFIDDLANSPAVRLARVDPTPLSDQALEAAFRHALLVGAPHAIRRFALEILRRGELNDKPIDQEMIFVKLAENSETLSARLQWVQSAAKAATESHRSPVMHLLAELELRLQRAEIDEFQILLHRIRSRYGREPGVEQALMGMMRNFGAMGAEISRSGAEGQEAEKEETSAVWTPDSERSSTDDPPSSKSKIWVPGD